MTKRELYKTELWADIVSIQNRFYCDSDIITITGFMSVEETIKMIQDYKQLHNI